MQTAAAQNRNLPDQAPLHASIRAQLVQDTSSLDALKEAARRHGDAELEDYEARIEFDYARNHFELGCWLAYYALRVGRTDGLKDRIDCSARIIRSGIRDIGYKFYTVFRFGERQFDTCFEMGDADQVFAALYERAQTDLLLAAGLEAYGIRPRT